MPGRQRPPSIPDGGRAPEVPVSHDVFLWIVGLIEGAVIGLPLGWALGRISDRAVDAFILWRRGRS